MSRRGEPDFEVAADAEVEAVTGVRLDPPVVVPAGTARVAGLSAVSTVS